MAGIKINQLDYRYVLVDAYKDLGLNENELAVLLVCDNILKEESVLITRELLSLKMTLSLEELDNIMVELMNKGFLEYATVSEKFVTSILPAYVKIENYVANAFLNEKKMIDDGEAQEAMKNIFARFEKTLGRSLAPVEFEKIKEWVSSGISEEKIINTLEECASRSSKVTLRAVDKQLVKNMSSDEIKKEGYSPISEKWEKDIEKSIEIVNKDWIK